MATKFTVTYDGDDAEHVYTVKPKHILRIEREGGGIEASVESSYRLAWLASGSAADFDTWLEDVEDILPVEPDEQGDDANPS